MYYRPRIIPCLSIIGEDLVKTTKFKNPRYLGDPVNAVKIFNDKGVDELCVLDIRASSEKQAPNMDFIRDIASIYAAKLRRRHKNFATSRRDFSYGI